MKDFLHPPEGFRFEGVSGVRGLAFVGFNLVGQGPGRFNIVKQSAFGPTMGPVLKTRRKHGVQDTGNRML